MRPVRPSGLRETPSTPVVSNSRLPMRRTPTGLPPASLREVISSSGGWPLYDDLPQPRDGWALKTISPLISRQVRQTTLIQCMTRTGKEWRR